VNIETNMKTILETLAERGFIAQTSDEQLGAYLAKQPVTVYAGFDPTAPSLHVGHLLPVMALSHFQRHGHKVIALFGGATGMIGDPSGRSDERNLQSLEVIAENLEGLRSQMARILEFSGPNPAIMVDNNDWIGPMTFVDWLREVGKHFSLGYMLGKESVRGRMESEEGISYTEFSYMTMQAYDFVHLFEKHSCTLQCGGNDQWGNITAGIDLVRRKCGAQVHGLTFPLLTTSGGEKFGKSAGNAVWLDSERTSPYHFYQYWMQTTDADVERMLKYFTFVDAGEIAELCEAHTKSPEQRQAQKRLAAETTRMIHGDHELARVEAATNALFHGNLRSLDSESIMDIFSHVPTTDLDADRVTLGVSLLDLLVESGICKSKGDARRAVEQGAIYLNDVRVHETDYNLNRKDLLCDSVIVLRRGKKDYHLIRLN